ncbi:long-chain-fatty-acid--CoA ligase [Tomitella fengzijianii]|uniref:Long-chain fatty acid--CoA ligase n=1 Tax=Tomitella fengzijianii TaxID=2597660 RepID=A0A516X2N5_9ACTN|nr:long-chain fatty acid--CoA ligase [Tomitella fengzijianii]QDQ97342.1 long-chain fatty acid--CoA ligase [Tomitella fengzijianii]
MLNLSVVLEDSARRYPDRTALVCAGRRLSYRQVDEWSNAIANLLASRGVTPGARVALSCPNIPEFVAMYHGILKAGAVVVPLNIMLKPQEIAYHLNDSGAEVYLCFEGDEALPTGDYGRAGFADAHGCREMFTFAGILSAGTGSADGDPGAAWAPLEGMPRTFATSVRSPEDTAVILYTSGTTGRPKGAELTHANMTLNALTANRLFDSNAIRHDTYLLTLPLFHSFGQTVMMNAGLATGATLVLLPRFEARAALDLMLAEEISVFAGVPTMYWSLLGALDETVDVARIADNLRVAISGGAALPEEILSDFADRFGIPVLEGYGLSESSPLALFVDPQRGPRPGSIGVPVWGIEARLVDADWDDVPEGGVGELAIRGHNVMKGYLNRLDATAEVLRDGWFRTGDLARRDEDGYYFIVDRAKDLIVRGGYNVYPREIEELLLTHPAVSLAAVIGTPDERHGEEIAAFVILEPGAQIGADALSEWCKERLAAYKYPRSIEFVTTLPMTATGKILKRELTAARQAVAS